jgi:hypothetical protein
MFKFFKERRQFAELKDKIAHKANRLCQERGRLPNDILAEFVTRSGMMNVAPALSEDRARSQLRTPRDLAPFLELVLSLPPELSAWLTAHIQPVLASFGLPMGVGGDIMLAFENANYVLCGKLDAAAKHLAFSLCLMPTLGLARNTLMDLGTPFVPEQLLGSRASQDTKALDAAARQGFAPLYARSMGWNVEMRKAVVDQLDAYDPQMKALLRTDQVRARPVPVTLAWPRPPNNDAVDLLNLGIDDAGCGRLEAALMSLEAARRADPMIAPEALRNIAWVEAKQGHYASAVDHCREALASDPEYAEVWYHLGICLAKGRRFGEALDAYERAKAFGFSSGGLEPNIATCKRAVAMGAG